MSNKIVIEFKETGDEKYPHTYTAHVEGNITFGMGINALVKVLDMFITKYEQQNKLKNEENNLQLGTPKTTEESTGNGSIGNQTGTNNDHENDLRSL